MYIIYTVGIITVRITSIICTVFKVRHQLKYILSNCECGNNYHTIAKIKEKFGSKVANFTTSNTSDQHAMNIKGIPQNDVIRLGLLEITVYAEVPHWGAKFKR